MAEKLNEGSIDSEESLIIPEDMISEHGVSLFTSISGRFK
jgi:hypothetical protein